MDAAKDAPSDIKGLDRIQYTSNSELEAKLIFLVKQELPNFKARSDSAFDSMKSRVLETLQIEQGQNIGTLATNVGEDKALVQSVVRAMVGSSELKTKGQKKGMIYFTPDFDLRKAPR